MSTRTFIWEFERRQAGQEFERRIFAASSSTGAVSETEGTSDTHYEPLVVDHIQFLTLKLD